MVESQQAGNGELRSPEVVDTAAQPSALVPADPDPRRGRVGRWWKRVLGAGTQGAAGRVFPGLDRLLEQRLEKLVAEQDERIAREVETRVAREASRLGTRIARVAALAAAGAVIGFVALLSGLGVISL